MFRSKKVMLAILLGGTLLSSGCGSGSWFKWLTVASQLGFNITGILDNVGVLTG